MKICHLTSVHPRYDTRIFLKECSSLAKAGYETSLVVADGKGDELREGINIHDVGSAKGRVDRIHNVTARVLDKSVLIDADIYHLHDPELIPAGLKLKHSGKRVIFDAHEDVPKQLLNKPYLNKPLRVMLSWVFKAYEIWACKRFDAVVAATPFIRDKFLQINANTIDVNNFPMLEELVVDEIDWLRKKSQVCYIGGIAKIRGVSESVEALQYVKSGARLQLGGRFTEKDFESVVKSLQGWSGVDELGWLDRMEVRSTMNRSIAGLVTLHPIDNYLDALPVKMFEYMAAGIPVIASNFDFWRKIIDDNYCGLCVNPLDPREIAEAIDYLIANPDRAEQMGRNGRRAVCDRFNWGAEERKLLELYSGFASVEDI